MFVLDAFVEYVCVHACVRAFVDVCMCVRVRVKLCFERLL